jgi:predicted nuclease with TOPRIM domain
MANEDLILEILKRVQADVSETRRRCQSLEMRMSALDDHMRGLQTGYAGVHSDLTQINARVGRIEQRLDLV